MKRLFLALTFFASLACAASAQMGSFFPGPGTVHSAGGGGGTLSLDGHSTATNTAGTEATPLTTTVASGVICAATYGGSGSGAVTSVTATGLTFSKLIGSTDGTGNTTEAWCAPHSSNFSGTITATWAAATAVTNLTVFGIANGNTSSPLDSTGFSTSTSPSITTVNAATFIFSIQSDGFTPTAGGGWTLIDPGGGSFFNTSEYQIVSSVQTGLVATITGTSSGGIVVAIKN